MAYNPDGCDAEHGFVAPTASRLPRARARQLTPDRGGAPTSLGGSTRFNRPSS